MNNTRRRQIRNEILTLETIQQLVEGYEGKYNGKVLSEEEVKGIKDALENVSSQFSDVSSTRCRITTALPIIANMLSSTCGTATFITISSSFANIIHDASILFL